MSFTMRLHPCRRRSHDLIHFKIDRLQYQGYSILLLVHVQQASIRNTFYTLVYCIIYWDRTRKSSATNKMIHTCGVVLVLTLARIASGQSVISEYFPGSNPIDAIEPYNTTFEPFANEGGPVDLRGALYQKDAGYIGMILPSGFVSSIYLGDEMYMMQMGRYLSWECTGRPGEYRATVLRRDIYSNGTMVVAHRCEIGKIEAPNVYYWVSSTTECPSVDTKFPESSKTTILLNATTIDPPDFGNLTCSAGANVTGLNTTGPAGLNVTYEDGLGVYQLQYDTIPPPYNPLKSGVSPPSFAYPGITSAVHGIYDIQQANAFRTIAGDGFGIVQYENDTFTQAMGRYISYECLDDGNLGYRSVASQSSFGQGGAVYFLPNAGGCSAGVFSDEKVTQVKITATYNTTCPDPSDDGRVQDLITRLNDDSKDGDSGPLCTTITPSPSGALQTLQMYVVCLSILFVSMLL